MRSTTARGPRQAPATNPIKSVRALPAHAQPRSGRIPGSRSFGCRLQFRPSRFNCPEPLREPRPGPGLDLLVPERRLRPGRLEVLEPRIGLFDQQQLVRFSLSGHVRLTSRVALAEKVGPGPDGGPLQATC